MPQSQISSYMEFDNNGGCVVGGNRTLSDAYVQRLVHAMEVLYYEKNGIHPLLVADAKLYLYPDNGKRSCLSFFQRHFSVEPIFKVAGHSFFFSLCMFLLKKSHMVYGIEHPYLKYLI